ncbi:MAG TPA: ABC transporter ATP-binding protein [Roseiflexaceae bacterium]|nr:ABC transporter ATP-binding protein [Roseiflexaceae bacterium]
MPPTIALTDLSKHYHHHGQPIVSVDGLTLTIPQGQILGLLGPNGAGKTTTIKMLCGLITPTRGRIDVNGFDLRRQRSAAMRQIGAVLEGTRNIYWRLSALQNLLYFGRLKGCSSAEIKGRSEQLLRRLGLWERRDDPVALFSRGMQQKVAIACALISDPPILLLDEPTLGLDVDAARVIKAWLPELARGGKTILLTSHELDTVEEVCERVVILRKGVVVADQFVGELLKTFRTERYQITIDGPIDDSLLPPLRDAVWSRVDDGMLLSIALDRDQSIYSVLDQVRSAGQTLISVQRVEPDLEDVFIQLTSVR